MGLEYLGPISGDFRHRRFRSAPTCHRQTDDIQTQQSICSISATVSTFG